MRRRGVGLLAALALAVLGLAAFGPRMPAERPMSFDPSAIGPDPAAYLAAAEAEAGLVIAEAEKRIAWAGDAGARTDWAVIYLHGFSATSEELRPVPDRVAAGLGANLYFARLAGHGQGGAALGQARMADWWHDLAEAMEIGRRIGERVLVIGTSTGGTLAALAATEPDLARDLGGIVFVSPNFGLVDRRARLLTLPFARAWLPLVAGRTRGFEPRGPRHGRYWTTRYPVTALVPMATAVAEARRRDVSAVTTPALFLFSDADEIVDAADTRAAAARWGGPAVLAPVEMGPGDDPAAHLVAGDILSPGRTAPVTARILDFARGL